MCRHTGRPFYYGPDMTKQYELPSLVVPETFRPYLLQHGHIIRTYVSLAAEDRFDALSTMAEEFLAAFPSWTELVEAADGDMEDWTETDHDTFREFLVWCCASLNYKFMLTWSY